jgi:hypothetical protein
LTSKLGVALKKAVFWVVAPVVWQKLNILVPGKDATLPSSDRPI